MTIYQHAQPGTFLRIVLGGSTIALAIVIWLIVNGNLSLGKNPEENQVTLWIIVAVDVIMAFSYALFHSLTVSLDNELIRLKFGIGLVSKKIRLDQISSCKSVRNSWLSGWGIHRLPRGWLYNVSGFDAVELELKKGGMIRIGTDEPEALCAVIKERITSLS